MTTTITTLRAVLVGVLSIIVTTYKNDSGRCADLSMEQTCDEQYGPVKQPGAERA